MTYSLGLSVLDFIPIFAFLIGSFFLVRIVLMERNRPCGRMMMAGTLLVFSGGLFKAVWKLFYTLNLADIQWMNNIQFVLLAPGFLAIVVALILLSKNENRNAPIAAIAVWKIPFLAIMTICSLGAHGILTYVSFKNRARLAGYLFIVAVLMMLGMSGMASGSEQTVSNQWIEEIMNSVGQIAFALGSYLLYKVFKSKKETPLAQAKV